MTFDITSYLTALVMLLGIIVGTIISPRVTHKIGAEQSRKDIIFKKKLEYFEKIVQTMEYNKKLYRNVLGKISAAKNDVEIQKLLDEIKKERKSFSMMSSPLYFNAKDFRIFSEKITNFVRIEKQFFNIISDIIGKDRNKKEKLTKVLEEGMKKLNSKENEIILEMKKGILR